MGFVVVWSLAPFLTALVFWRFVFCRPLTDCDLIERSMHGVVLHLVAMSYIIPRSKVCSIVIHATNQARQAERKPNWRNSC